MNKIERAHQMYREAKYNDAIGFYSEALSMAKTKPQKIALHSNRAACYLKLHHFKKAAEECTWVLELDHNHTGALMLRAQTLVTLKEYQSALFDVNRLIDLNPASEVYQGLKARLKTQLSLAPIPEDEAELAEEDEDRNEVGTKKEGGEDDINDMKDEGKDGLGQDAELEQKDAQKHNEKEETGHTRGKSLTDKSLPDLQKDERVNVNLKAEADVLPTHKIDKPSEEKPLGWQTNTKPKGHSILDYSKWDRVVDDSSDEESDDDDDECQPQFRFRVKNVGVHAFK